jgi:hypothetical protein
MCLVAELFLFVAIVLKQLQIGAAALLSLLKPHLVLDSQRFAVVKFGSDLSFPLFQ